MRTNIVIDDHLMKEAMALAKTKTKKETIQTALEEFVRNRKRLDLRELRGRVAFAEGYDYKAMRSR